MLRYKWPGNVRQLKNITEQMSVLSQEREITAEALRQFIPQDPESMQLATINNHGSHSYENERELLFKILYEMRGNVSELRRDMNNLRKQLDEANSINSQLNARTVTSIPNDNINLPSVDSHRSGMNLNQPQAEEAIAEEISEPETLNLSDLGRQMIEKALERNGGNRKKAAAELGISDRTLYRKIKQYGLEKD
jgi:DNA-binding NtrC family response regulator